MQQQSNDQQLVVGELSWREANKPSGVCHLSIRGREECSTERRLRQRASQRDTRTPPSACWHGGTSTPRDWVLYERVTNISKGLERSACAWTQRRRDTLGRFWSEAVAAAKVSAGPPSTAETRSITRLLPLLLCQQTKPHLFASRQTPERNK